MMMTMFAHVTTTNYIPFNYILPKNPTTSQNPNHQNDLEQKNPKPDYVITISHTTLSNQ